MLDLWQRLMLPDPWRILVLTRVPHLQRPMLKAEVYLRAGPPPAAGCSQARCSYFSYA
jgi:hypothetical protein